MAIRVELPREIVEDALKQAKSLRTRNAKAASNPIIKDALQKEELAIGTALNTLQETK